MNKSTRLESLREELNKSKRQHENTRDWWAVRFERLKDLCKEHGIWPQAAAIMANGTVSPDEPPRYAQILSMLRHERDKAIEEKETMKNAMAAELQWTLQFMASHDLWGEWCDRVNKLLAEYGCEQISRDGDVLHTY